MLKAKKTKKIKKSVPQPVAEGALSLSQLHPSPGSHHRRKVVGRGVGSGHGRHATRGMKGQKSRRGDSVMMGFEGGQTPILRRIPKRGFNPPFRTRYTVVNIQDLAKHFDANAQVNLEALTKSGLVKRDLPVKVLGQGEIKKPMTVFAQAFSKQAKDKIVAAGGTVQVL